MAENQEIEADTEEHVNENALSTLVAQTLFVFEDGTTIDLVEVQSIEFYGENEGADFGATFKDGTLREYDFDEGVDADAVSSALFDSRIAAARIKHGQYELN